MEVFTFDFTKSGAVGDQTIDVATAVGARAASLPDLSAMAAGTWALIVSAGSLITPSTVHVSGIWESRYVINAGFAANGGGVLAQYVMMAQGYDAQNPHITNKRAVAALLTCNAADDSLYSQATLAAVPFPSASTMKINWSVNGGENRKVNVVLITGLTGAKVVPWDVTAGVGAKAITGVGFNPDLVFHAWAYATAFPQGGAEARFGFGAMNKHGQQWANGFFSQDGVATSNSSRWQQTDACILTADINEGTPGQAHMQSMDADGFTTYWSSQGWGSMKMISLCLDGVSSKLGAFAAGTGTQVIDSRQGFMPKGALFTNNSALVGENMVPNTSAAWSLGMTDLTNRRMVSMFDVDNVSPSQAKNVWRSDYEIFVNAASTTDYIRASASAFALDSFSVTYNLAGDGREVLYLLLGDSGTDTYPVSKLDNVTTNQLATASGNQKKACTLSDGKHVEVVAETTANARFEWRSSDGQTVTDYGADIAGWSNGSIASYVDSGGTERLVAVWKQSGTGGLRTDGVHYVMVGTLSSSNTVLTWGTAVAIESGDAAYYNYPDVVAHAEGGATGGMAHVVYSYSRSGSSQVWTSYVPVTITATTAVAGSRVDGSNSGLATGIHTFPSIDIDPSTKRLLVTWSGGATGAGKGIRFRTAAYSAGPTWTWATEVEVSTGHYVPNNEYVGLCRWDATNSVVVLGGLVNYGGGPTLQFWDSSNFTAFTNQVNSSPTILADPSYGCTWAIDGSGHIHIFGSNYGSSRFQNITYRKATRAGSTLTLGTSSQYDVSVLNASTAASPFAWYSGGKVRWIWTKGNNAPYAIPYDQLTVAVDDQPQLLLTA